MNKNEKKKTGFRTINDIVRLGRHSLCVKSKWYAGIDLIVAASFFIIPLPDFIMIASSGAGLTWNGGTIFILVFVLCSLPFFALAIREAIRPECPICYDDEKIYLHTGTEIPWSDLLNAIPRRSHYLDIWSFRTYSFGDLTSIADGGQYVIRHISRVESVARQVMDKKKKWQEVNQGLENRPDSH